MVEVSLYRHGLRKQSISTYIFDVVHIKRLTVCPRSKDAISFVKRTQERAVESCERTRFSTGSVIDGHFSKPKPAVVKCKKYMYLELINKSASQVNKYLALMFLFSVF